MVTSGPIFGNKPWAMYEWVKLSKFGLFKSFKLSIPSRRVFYGLLEYKKKFKSNNQNQSYGLLNIDEYILLLHLPSHNYNYT